MILQYYLKNLSVKTCSQCRSNTVAAVVLKIQFKKREGGRKGGKEGGKKGGKEGERKTDKKNKKATHPQKSFLV